MSFSNEQGSVLLNILLKQKDLLSKILESQKNIYSAVTEKDWLKLDSSLRETSYLSTLFEKTEEERTNLLGNNLSDFYQLSTQFPTEQQNDLNENYRDVKQLALQSKMENDSLNSYVSNAKALLDGFFAALMPHRKSTIYNKTGAKVNRNVESLVLNQVL